MNPGDEMLCTDVRPDHCSVPGCAEPCVELEGDPEEWEGRRMSLWMLYCTTHMELGANEPHWEEP